MSRWLTAILLFIWGACFGSFYLVLGKRGPKKEKVVNDRSRCDKCGHNLAWYDLIPIISYITLLGKCRYCKKNISILNPIIEIVMGAFFAFAYLHYSISYEFWIFIIISSIMMIIFISDFSAFTILDSPLIVGSILIIILDLIYKGLKPTLLYVVSGITMFCIMLLIKKIGDLIFKKDSLGGGDIKFAFVIGLTVGFRLSLIVLILSAFLALPYSYAYFFLKKNNEVPFGPFLASSLFIVFLFIDKFNTLLDAITLSL